MIAPRTVHRRRFAFRPFSLLGALLRGRSKRLARRRGVEIGAAAERLEDRTLLSVIGVFDDPGFVDTGGAAGDESDNIQASLIAAGHTVNTFTGTTAADFDAALSTNEILVIPELANGDLSAALSADAIAEITTFVSSGGGLIISGDFQAFDVDFLNTVFGFSITDGGSAAGAGSAITAAAAGTAFAGGPATLGDNNETSDLVTASLPTGSASIYEDTGETTVALIPFGQGEIVYLGWDWFNSDPPNVGGQDGSWQGDLGALGRSVTQVTPTDPVINGTNADEEFLLRRNAANSALVEVLIDGDLEFTFTYETLNSITINGQGGDDTLVVDFVNGDPVPADDGVAYSGGSGTSDQLVVQGDGESHIIARPSGTVSGEGTITVGTGSPITYTGLEPVTVSRSPHVTFITGGSTDDVEVSSPSRFVTRIEGSSNGVPFETHTLYNVGELVLDARSNDTGGNDQIVIDAPLGLGVGGRVDESENNDTPFAGDFLFGRPFGQGAIDPMGDIDFWRTFADAGDLIFAYVDTSQSTTGTDSVMQILDDNQVLIETDDDDGPGLTSVVAGAFVPLSGDVFFRINEFADNGTITPYRLYPLIVDPADSADEVESNDTAATATPMTATMMTGRAAAGDVDNFSFFAPAGSEIVVMLDDDPDDDGARSSLLIELLDANGTVLESSSTQALVPITAPASGDYFVRITGLGGTEGDYRLVTRLYDPQEDEPQSLRRVDAFSGDGDDEFLVTPPPDFSFFESDRSFFDGDGGFSSFEGGGATITVNGDAPTTPPGDTLAVNLRGVTGAEVPAGGSSSGLIDSESHAPVVFTSIETLITTDARESNDTLATASVLGSLKKITLNDLSIDTQTDVDFFKYTAQDTGKLIVNAHFAHAVGDLDIQVQDASGNLIAGSFTVTDDEQLVIPVVSQEMYFIRVSGFAGAVNNYDLEIENFAAPVPNGVHIEPGADTGMMNNDNVTANAAPRFVIQADLQDFADMGITVLDAAQAAAGNVSGAAVEVHIISSTSGVDVAGFASPIGVSNTLFEFTPAAPLADDVYFVSAAVRIFDGQTPGANGRTPLSDPLWLTIDTTAPQPMPGSSFVASLDGAQEVQPVTTDASGAAQLWLSPDQSQLAITIELVGLDLDGNQTPADPSDNVVGMHIHRGAPGVNGPVVFGFISPNNDLNGDLQIDAVNGRIISTWDLNEGNGTTLAAELANLLAGNLYFNVHTPANPGGEIRGQINSDLGSFILAPSSDTGMSALDRVTSKMQPAFIGKAEPNSKVRVFANDILVGQGVVNSDGSWEVTVEPLRDGQYGITIELEDLAGNITRGIGRLDQSEFPSPLVIWIDTTQPNTPHLDLISASDSGRSDDDNITNDNTPTFDITFDDTINGDGNPFPQDVKVRIYDRPGNAGTNGEVLIYDSFAEFGDFIDAGYLQRTLTSTLNDPNGVPLADGIHNLKLEVEDRAGNISHDFLLNVLIDTVAPPVSITDIDPASTDTGVEGQPETFTDRITSDTATGFYGSAEANTIVRLYVDGGPISDEVIDGSDEFGGLTVAIPLDGDDAFPEGQWNLAAFFDLNDPARFPFDGLRQIGVTAEDVAGNISYTGNGEGDSEKFLDIFIDTQGPRVLSVAREDGASVFTPKPNGDPDPPMQSLDITFFDQTDRVSPEFLYDAVNNLLATEPGNYALVGDHSGPILIESVEIISRGAGAIPAGGTSGGGSTGSGAVIIDGGDRDDHGDFDGTNNVDGWQYIQQMVEFALNGSSNGAPNDILAIGPSSSEALDAITSVANVLGAGLTVVNDGDITTANFSDFKMIYVPSDSNTSGGITTAELALLEARKADVQDFVNSGGSLVALTEENQVNPYSWLELPDPFVIDDNVETDEQYQTQALIDAGLVITNAELINGTPLHNAFVGPPGFNGLVPFVFNLGSDGVNDDGGGDDQIITLGLAPGSAGIGVIPGVTLTVRLNFSEPLPDDRYSLTLFDQIADDAGNALDGDVQASGPGVAAQLLPSGDGGPGETFLGRFTVDSRPEIGAWGQAGISVDINGNFLFDPRNGITGGDAVNRDLVFDLGIQSDHIFAGEFRPGGALAVNGYDRLGAYGLIGGRYRFLLDFNDNGRVDAGETIVSNFQVNAFPVSGNFAPGAAGDEIGLFTGSGTWHFDTDGDNLLDTTLAGNMMGMPITGDFDGDGQVDLATHVASTDTFFFSLSGSGGSLLGGNANTTHSFAFGFPGVLDRPFSGGDFDLDGVDDIGLTTPNQSGNAAELEWYLLQSGGEGFAGLTDGFSPLPLGSDLFTVFGNNLALPVAGNFDPPIDDQGNTAPVLNPISDRLMSPKAGSLRIPLRSNDADGDGLTFTAIIGDTDADKAYKLDQQYDFQLIAGSAANNYWHNARGAGEKYLSGFFILPDGSLYQWGGSLAKSKLLGRLSSRFHEDPSLLIDVPAPAGVQVQTLVNGSMLTLFPLSDDLGSFEVTVTVTDSIASDSKTFTVTVANSAPVIPPIGDQTMSPDSTLDLKLSASDSDGDPLSYSVTAGGGDPAAQLAHDLDQVHDFQLIAGSAANNFWHNARGLGEKYLAGFYILPNGELYKWGGSVAASTLIGKLDSRYHADPGLLVDAPQPVTVNVVAAVNGPTLSLTPPVGFLGDFSVTVTVTDGIAEDSETFNVSVVNQAPVLTAVADQTMTRGNSLELALSASDVDGDALTYSAEVESADAVAQLAYDLDQQHDFRLIAGSAANNYWHNARGLGEKYLAGYYILPNGELYKWGGSIASSTLIGTLDSRYHDDPSLLVDVQPPQAPAVAVTVNGSTLVLTPPTDFTGSFRVKVSVSDGRESDSASFLVTVEEDPVTSDPAFVNLDLSSV